MKNLLIISALLIGGFGLGQSPYLVVNHDSISRKDFENSYALNIQNEGFDEALNTYIEFTLLKQEAEKTKIDTSQVFKNVYQQNMQIFYDKYLYSSEVTDRLVEEIWPKLQFDKKAEIYTVGISNPYNPKLVQEREKIAHDIYAHVCKNKTKTPQAAQFLQDFPTKNLWLRPFVISAEIEKVVFDTKLGSCSQMQDSENGKFFVKVVDERASAGVVFLEYMYNTDKSKLETALDSLKAGKNFSKIKQKYGIREPKNSYSEKPRFGADLPDSFYKAIKHLDSNELTEIFADNNGWYLIQVQNQQKPENLAEWKDWITEKLKQSDYALEYVKNNEQIALKKVEVSENETALNAVLSAAGKNYFDHEESLIFAENKLIWKADFNNYHQSDLVKELNLSKMYLGKGTDFELFIKDVIPRFKKQFILNSYIENLVKYEPSLEQEALLMHRAILVNHYLDNYIYYEADMDSLGKNNFLKTNRDRFSWPVRYELEVIRYSTDEQRKKILKMMKKGKKASEIMKQFEGELNEKGGIAVNLIKDKFYYDDGYLPKEFNPAKKIQEIPMFNQHVIVRKISKLQPSLKTISEAGTAFQQEYRSYYYDQKLKSLKNNATISLPDTFSP
ncbi:MAG: peptidylprolyl isomerase [Flavobacteriaceae bacterium]|nr:peptidylprolyl isomerase [Flavobacteriaceae bacterium]